MENLPVDFFVTSQAFTKQTYRDAYPAIDPNSPSNSQAGKVIVITGSSKGLGKIAFAASFAKANPKGIVLVARTAESLEVVAKEIKVVNPNIEVLPVPTDLTNAESVAALWEKVKAKFGHADVLVNNAGTFPDSAPVKVADAAKWWYDFEVNDRGTFLVTQGFLNLLGDKKGTVINVTTGAAHSIFPSLSAYSMSKLLALQLGAYVAAENPNITAISLHPGILPTDMAIESFKRFALDTPDANWSVEELEGREEEIVGYNKLTIALTGKFGMEQFA
ncbi:uncharacterized protein PAC_20121 [Phialocephala subalpina]|uniref:Peroxisomal short-chain alcohol dehydrogenase n=1 Tax=Phialocephala subalpina TaxID=576137 RepID=A0A1L7XZ28_9HELO|nr:uncharacterized protein PAC_20121 [Phialocephala subalpina]